MSYLLVLSTASSRKEALKLADILLEKRLAACVNISGPVDSVYWWNSKREKAREVMMFIKTTRSSYPRLEKTLHQQHSYSVPEIIAIPIAKGSKPYLAWLHREARG